METKNNMKGIYDTHEYEACGKENESQENVIKCNILTKMNKEYEGNDSLEYDKILNGDVREQLKISQIFVSNMEIL